jgi:hypothetical protein
MCNFSFGVQQNNHASVIYMEMFDHLQNTTLITFQKTKVTYSWHFHQKSASSDSYLNTFQNHTFNLLLTRLSWASVSSNHCASSWKFELRHFNWICFPSALTHLKITFLLLHCHVTILFNCMHWLYVITDIGLVYFSFINKNNQISTCLPTYLLTSWSRVLREKLTDL